MGVPSSTCNWLFHSWGLGNPLGGLALLSPPNSSPQALGLPELISSISCSFSSPQKAGQEVSKMLGGVGSTGRHWGWPWAPSMHFSRASSAW